MPTVRLTKRLREDILRKMKVIVDEQRSQLPELPDKAAAALLTHIIERFNLTPHKNYTWLNNRVNQVFLTDLEVLGERHNLLVGVPSTNILLPQSLAYNESTIKLNYAHIPEKDIALPDEIAEQLFVTVRNRMQLEEECNAFDGTAKELLNKCTTIKQLIEAWPQSEKFIPSGALAKHYEQEKKQRKRGVYLDEDKLSNLNSLLLTSKIT